MPTISVNKAIRDSEAAADELRKRIELLKSIRSLTPRARILDYGNVLSVNCTSDGSHWSSFGASWKGDVVEVTCLTPDTASLKSRSIRIIEGGNSWSIIEALYQGHAQRQRELLASDSEG